MFFELIRKDVRICRLPILAVLMGVLVPLGFGMMIGFLIAEEAHQFSVGMLIGVRLVATTGQGTLVLVAGMIFAAERNDRSAEFLAYLPASRMTIVVSKLCVLFGCFTFVWWTILSGESLMFCLSEDYYGDLAIIPPMSSLMRSAVFTLGMAGAGWAASTRLESPGACVLIGLFSVMLIIAPLGLLQLATGWPSVAIFDFVQLGCFGCFGALCIVWGSIDYVRRVEP